MYELVKAYNYDAVKQAASAVLKRACNLWRSHGLCTTLSAWQEIALCVLLPKTNS